MPVEQTEESGYKRISIQNSNGVQLKCISLGATITSLKLPNSTDIVLGFQNIKDYESNSPYIGCSVGRVANRMRNATFTLDGMVYRVSANVAPHTLHGGEVGFNKANWSVISTGENSVTMQHVSPSGDQGYPGTLTVCVKYQLTEKNEVVIEYTATTDAPTIVNMTNHTYFNLAGRGEILDHVLLINGTDYTPLDKDLIADGTLEPVKGTPLDFTTPTPIGQRIQQTNGGYDINYDLLGTETTYPQDDPLLRHCATLQDPSTNNKLSVYTDQPGVQLYTGNFLDGSYIGKDGKKIEKHTGVCLETQAWPNAINNPKTADQVVLRPGSEYKSKTVWALEWC